MITARRRGESALGMHMSVPESHIVNVYEGVRHQVHDVMRSCVHKVIRQDIQSIDIGRPRSVEILCLQSHEVSHRLVTQVLPNTSAKH